MIKKEILSSILLEGSTQMSAVLPKRNVQNGRDLFSFFIPVVLNNTVLIEKETFDNFQVVFYNQQNFTEEFNSKTSTLTTDFKSFEVLNQESFLPNFQKNLSNNFYFDKNIITNAYNISFDINNITSENNLNIYKIAFTNTQSKEMLNGNFNCFRIFCLKDDNIIYDSDIVFFPSVNFLNEVFENRKVYDFSYFVDMFYFKNFEENLNFRVPQQNSLTEDKFVKIIAGNQIDLNMATGSVTFDLQYNGKNNNKILSKTIDLSFIKEDINIIDNNNFFKEVVIDYMSGKRLFAFSINCTINFENQSLDKIYSKNLRFYRQSPIIINIFNIVGKKISNDLFSELNLEVEQDLKDDVGSFFLYSSLDELSLQRNLKKFYIFDVLQNNESIIDSLFTEDSLSLNSYLSLYNKSLFELFSLESKSLKLYFKNNQRKIFSTIKIIFKSNFTNDFTKEIFTEKSLNRRNISNVYSDVNALLRSNTIVDSRNAASLNLNRNSVINSYESIKIINLEKFNNIAYNLGYFEENSQNSDVRGNIIDFLSSSVFCIDIHERIEGIKDTNFRFKKYFYGEEILDLSNLESNDNRVFLNNAFLSSINFNLSSLTKSLDVGNQDFINLKTILNHNQQERIDNIQFVKNFIQNINLSIVKKINITIIPIPKIIKVYQGSGIDDSNNIIFDSSVIDDVKKNVNIQFLNMFYDSNSSLNWDRFNSFKKFYFYSSNRGSNSNLPIKNISAISSSFANIFSPIWDYLSSDLYLKKNEIFSNVNVVSKNNFLELVPEIENNYDSFSSIVKNFHFENFFEDYFDFSKNNDMLSVKDLGLSYSVSDFSNNRINEPSTIRFVKNSSLNAIKFKFDISFLKIRHTNDEIRNAEMFLKHSFHPLIVQENESVDFRNSGLYSVSLGDEENYITQNSTYMKSINRKYFNGYNIPSNVNNMDIQTQNNKMFLNVYLDNESDFIDTSTFRDMFDFCVQNECFILKDFYIRFALSIKINSNHYCCNLNSVIPRINLQNSDIRISNIRNITI